MIEVSSLQDFETQVLASDLPVLVDFWAPWCAPCKALAPTFEAVALENTNVKFVKVNVDDSNIASQYGVRGIPTLIMFKDGKPVQTLSGNQTKAKLETVVKGYV